MGLQGTRHECNTFTVNSVYSGAYWGHGVYIGAAQLHVASCPVRGSAGREALRLCCAAQAEQIGRSSREARLLGQLSASRHASALHASALLADTAGAAGRLRGTESTLLCFAGDVLLFLLGQKQVLWWSHV